MKYPKHWEAKQPFAAWSKTDKEEYFEVTVHVDRPGTPDNQRRIRAKMDRAQTVKLRDALNWLLERH